MIRSFQIQKWLLGNGIKGEMTVNQGDGVKKDDRKVDRDGNSRRNAFFAGDNVL